MIGEELVDLCYNNHANSIDFAIGIDDSNIDFVQSDASESLSVDAFDSMHDDDADASSPLYSSIVEDSINPNEVDSDEMLACVAFDKALQLTRNRPAVERKKLLKSATLQLNREKKVTRSDTIDIDFRIQVDMALRGCRSKSPTSRKRLMKKIGAQLFEEKNSVSLSSFS